MPAVDLTMLVTSHFEKQGRARQQSTLSFSCVPPFFRFLFELMLRPKNGGGGGGGTRQTWESVCRCSSASSSSSVLLASLVFLGYRIQLSLVHGAFCFLHALNYFLGVGSCNKVCPPLCPRVRASQFLLRAYFFFLRHTYDRPSFPRSHPRDHPTNDRFAFSRPICGNKGTIPSLSGACH